MDLSRKDRVDCYRKMGLGDLRNWCKLTGLCVWVAQIILTLGTTTKVISDLVSMNARVNSYI